MNNSSFDSRFVLVGVILTASALVLSWGCVFVGGVAGVWAWSLGVQLGVPLVGLVWLVIVGIHAVRKRCWTWLHGLSVVVALAALWPVLWMFGVSKIAYPSSIEAQQPTASVRVPLNGEVVVLWGGDALEHNYHAAYPDQRWAYDLAVKPVLVMSDQLDDYGCFGKPVVAPAAGTVVSARGDLRDHKPGQLSGDFENPLGNHVVLKLEATQTYLFLAHLRQDSLSVAEGERVERGTALGECGNSGNTSEPHVHIHHQRQSPDVAMFGFAEGLPLYFDGHNGDSMPRGGIDISEDRPSPTGALISHVD